MGEWEKGRRGAHGSAPLLPFSVAFYIHVGSSYVPNTSRKTSVISPSVA